MISSESIYVICQGNAGALNICLKLLKEHSYDVLVRLLELKIIGWKVWVCYKDLYEHDVNKTDQENDECQWEFFKSKVLDGSILPLLKQTKDWEYYEGKK